MFIQVIPNRGSPPAILLRESYREGGKVKKRTLCNLTRWPPSLLEGFKALLKGGTVISAPAAPEVFTIRRALPHGHVAAVLADPALVLRPRRAQVADLAPRAAGQERLRMLAAQQRPPADVAGDVFLIRLDVRCLRHRPASLAMARRAPRTPDCGATGP
jgi:hypothetical protein